MAFQQCLLVGNIHWNDNKQLMTCPAGQLQLAEHLKHGMFYEVFSWEGVKQDKAAILSLCQADNFDSAFALGETELQLLKSIHASLHVMRPPVGKNSWDVIRETTAVSCGQRWSPEDLAGVYDFAKVSGDAHLKFLTGTVAIHIPWESGAADCPVLPAEGENFGRFTREELRESSCRKKSSRRHNKRHNIL